MSDATKNDGEPSGERPGLARRLLTERDEFARAVSVTRVALRSLVRSDIPRMAAALA